MLIVNTNMDEEKVIEAFKMAMDADYELVESLLYDLKVIKEYGLSGKINSHEAVKRIEYACKKCNEVDRIYLEKYGEHFGRIFNRCSIDDMTEYIIEIDSILAVNLI